jgi:hypothetical protein
MKKFFYILLFLGMIACDEYFHKEEISIGLIEDERELAVAADGVYGLLAEAFNSYDGLGFYNPNVKGDDLRNDYPGYLSCKVTQTIPDEYYQRTSENWKSLYAVIVSSNNIIKQYGQIPQNDLRTRNILGEVYFLRAYCYFRLTRVYGQIPLVDDIEIDYLEPAASFGDIYAFIEKDLTLAISLLPGSSNEARVPGVTSHRGTAKAFLAEVYLNWAGYPVSDLTKYKLSADMAEQVIDSADYFGFGLLDDYADLWNDNYLVNKESVFSLHFADPRYSNNPAEINLVYRGNLWRTPVSDIDNSVFWSDNMIIYFPAVENKFFDLFPGGYRKETTFFTDYYDSNGERIHLDHSNGCARIGYRKFYYDPVIVEGRQFYTYENLDLFLGSSKAYLFRFAHTLLTFAEAAARSGNLTGKAYECVNKIRRRANQIDPDFPSIYDLQPGLSAEAFADSVVWERAWELAGEPEGRWFDLVRTGLFEKLQDFRYENEGGVPEYPVSEHIYSSLPPEDQLLNPFLKNK